MMHHRGYRRAAVLALAVIAGCNNPFSHTPTLAGRFLLQQVNGSQVPFNTGSLAPRAGTSDQCSVLISSGYLDVTPATGRFVLSYERIDSCTQRSLGASQSSGWFAQHGAQLAFDAEPVSGSTKRYAGEMLDDEVRVQDDVYVYTFRR